MRVVSRRYRRHTYDILSVPKLDRMVRSGFRRFTPLQLPR
jgi:hypothetical protein